MPWSALRRSSVEAARAYHGQPDAGRSAISPNLTIKRPALGRGPGSEQGDGRGKDGDEDRDLVMEPNVHTTDHAQEARPAEEGGGV
eukprot:957680-Lingulodinium_polyedra.AAC.1